NLISKPFRCGSTPNWWRPLFLAAATAITREARRDGYALKRLNDPHLLHIDGPKQAIRPTLSACPDPSIDQPKDGDRGQHRGGYRIAGRVRQSRPTGPSLKES